MPTLATASINSLFGQSHLFLLLLILSPHFSSPFPLPQTNARNGLDPSPSLIVRLDSARSPYLRSIEREEESNEPELTSVGVEREKQATEELKQLWIDWIRHPSGHLLYELSKLITLACFEC